MPIKIWMRIGIKTMPIHMRILPHILHILENRSKNFTFIHSNGSTMFFSFFISGKCVMISSILDSIFYFHWNFQLHVKLISFRIGRIRMLLILRNRQNNADPAQSDSTSRLLCWTLFDFWSVCYCFCMIGKMPELVSPKRVPFSNIWLCGRSGVVNFASFIIFLPSLLFFIFRMHSSGSGWELRPSPHQHAHRDQGQTGTVPAANACLPISHLSHFSFFFCHLCFVFGGFSPTFFSVHSLFV